MHDRDAAAATLWQLKGLGVRIAIDDFGTGYSSLAYLRRFPIDMLKVAREFVDGLGRDAHDDVITRAIVELASPSACSPSPRASRPPSSRSTSAALGCDLAQGYLFSRPIDAEAARASGRVGGQEESAEAGAPRRLSLPSVRRDQACGLDQPRLLPAPGGPARRPRSPDDGGTRPSPAAPTPPPRWGRVRARPVKLPR